MFDRKRFSEDHQGRGRTARRTAGALALAAAIVLAGCGGDEADDPVAGSSTPAPVADGATAAPVPEDGSGGLSGPEAGPEDLDVGHEGVETDEGTPVDESTPADEGDGTDEAAPVDEEPADVPGDPEPEPDDGTDDANGLSPGDPCSLEEGSPDCIDPDGDGEGVYLLDGADCVAMYADAGFCEDLDGDGHAGYPDSEGTTFPDSENLPGEPCSTEEGSPDCIDADGDGEGVILLGGEECIAMYADASFCEDTDGDGYAGAVDGEGNLPYPYGG
jgi:hypothetical protein